MSDGGKGSSPRPYSVPKEQYDKNWELIFGKKKTLASVPVAQGTPNPLDGVRFPGERPKKE